MWIRALLQILVVPAATGVVGAAIIILCPFNREGDLSLRLGRIWCRLLCAAAGVRVQVEAREHVPREQPVVFVSNHQSLFDPPALMLAIPVNFRVIAKRSLFFIPVFGQALWAAGIIPINRADRERAVASMQRAADRIRGGLSVLVFAEGTRSRDGHLQPFKKGAFVMAIQAQAPVQPVLVSGSRQVLPKGWLWARPGTVTVQFLPPVATAGLTFADRDALIATVAARLQAAQAAQPAARAARGATR
jgi:1-acyl-sn-glycerol-3-phosphate acyltransferase